MTDRSGEDWPRLAVVSDVVPTRTVGGELLLYRLLAGWPSDRLLVVCGNLIPDLADRGLSGVKVERLWYTAERLHRTRLRPFVNVGLLATRDWLAQRVHQRLKSFHPDAVLTVTHGHLCLAAAGVAKRLMIPLHLVSHDDWSMTVAGPKWATGSIERAFAAMYWQAASRLCVSPNMVDEYRNRYGAVGTVLYPNRGDDSPPAKVRATPRSGLVVGFAGSLFGSDYLEQLGELAAALERVGGRLVVYTQHELGSLSGRPNVISGGFVPARELADLLGKQADVLFVPTSFRSEERRTAHIAFPSKLADYTAIGLPLLVCGPDYCSAVRWMRENPGLGELVTSPDRESLAAVVDRLAADPVARVSMAERCVAVGERDFSLPAAKERFQQALSEGGSTP